MLWVLVSLVSGLVMGCATQLEDSGIRALVGSDQETSVSPLAGYPVAGFVVLPTEKFSSRSPFMSGFTSFWSPSTNQVAEAINLLPEYLIAKAYEKVAHPEYTKQLPGVLERLPETVCQAVGVAVKGERGIFLNCLPYEGPSNNYWKTHYLWEFDGGPKWWSVVYLPEKKCFTTLHIDLGF
jgi:hypothetical protein